MLHTRMRNSLVDAFLFAELREEWDAIGRRRYKIVRRRATRDLGPWVGFRWLGIGAGRGWDNHRRKNYELESPNRVHNHTDLNDHISLDGVHATAAYIVMVRRALVSRRVSLRDESDTSRPDWCVE